MENKEEIIGTIILIIIAVGIISYAVIDHRGLSENKAQTLVINDIAKEFNISKSEIGISSIDSTTFGGHSAYEVRALFHAKNKTHNISYIVNENGTVSKQSN